MTKFVMSFFHLLDRVVFHAEIPGAGSCQPYAKNFRILTGVSWIRPCAYRPFDHRFILWNPLVVDWPRGDLIDSLDLPDNFCLIARRQSPEVSEYSYFWSTDQVPIDGILRSDNRGNEYCYPLFTRQENQARSNISKKVIAQLADQWNYPDLDPKSVFYLVCAVCQSNDYRTRFLTALCEETPRMFFPRSRQLAILLAEIGKQIVSCQSNGLFAASKEEPVKQPLPNATKRIEFNHDKLHIPGVASITMDEWVWNYKIGSHQVLKKYSGYRTKENRLEGLERDIVAIADRIHELAQLQNRVDIAIQKAGGMDRSFLMKGISGAHPH